MSGENLKTVAMADDLRSHQTLRVAKVIFHEKDFIDLALLQLYPAERSGKCAVFGNTVQPACIRRPDDVKIDSGKCFTSGWRASQTLMATSLQFNEVNVVEFNVSINYFKTAKSSSFRNVKDHSLTLELTFI